MNAAEQDRIDHSDEAATPATALDGVIERALRWSDAEQHEEGYWCGNLESNSCMEAQWVLAMHILGLKDDPKYDGVIRCILNEQREDGSWEIYHDAPMGDINTTVECYAALRSADIDPDSEPMVKARKWILAHGGLKELRVFSKYWLALIGEWPWEKTPTLIPELIWLPPWLPFNIYDFSSWARATLVPLCLLSARRPVTPLAPEHRMDELFPEGRGNFDFSMPAKAGVFSWETLFMGFDLFFGRVYQNLPYQPGRDTAMAQCRDWVVAHQDADGAWGGIQPPWIYSVMALYFEGWPLSHPVIKRSLDAWGTHWSYEKNGGTYIQACMSPVWDTVLTLLAQEDCDETIEASESMKKAFEWTLNKQVFTGGDWQVRVKDVEPAGWAFEHENAAYPDVDDTSVAVIVLTRILQRLKKQGGDDAVIARLETALDKAVKWMIGFQCRNGGWAAFDKDNTSEWVCKIPFCDFGEVLDPPSVDVTAHVLEALGVNGYTAKDPVVAKALEYVRDEQEEDGSWFGRWGVNHIYGTAAVLPGLEAIGEDMSQAYVRKAADWVASKQNEDGGWGESCGSYMDDQLRGVGDSTASQTGWALMALTSTGAPKYNQAVRNGVSWLQRTQLDNGSWHEEEYTGTGFPGYGVGHRIDLKGDPNTHQGRELARGFMINYNMYRHYFPLMALGRARKYLAANEDARD